MCNVRGGIAVNPFARDRLRAFAERGNAPGRGGGRAWIALVRRLSASAGAGSRRRALAIALLVPPLLLGAEALARARLSAPWGRVQSTAVYARPMVLERGARVDASRVEEHLRRIGYRPTRGRRVGNGEYFLGSGRWVIGRRPFRPAAELAQGGALAVRFDWRGRISLLELEDGTRLSRALLEPELLARVGEGADQERVPVRLADVPEHLVQAVLRVEDQRFPEHHGLDFRRIVAAAMANVRAGTIVQGGSTLTQQLAKNLFLTPDRSFVRKLREAAMAVVLEARHSKDEILEAYLNEVYLGQDGSAALHGFASAARYYFGRDVGDLTLAESALLAGIIRAPNAYAPFRHPEAALARRALVLRLMHDAGLIDDEALARADAAPLGLAPPAAPMRSAGWFVDWVAGSAGPAAGRALVTTLDPTLQRAAEKAVSGGIARLERDFDWLRQAAAGEPLQAALVALDPRTGEVLAMVGGRDYRTSPYNRVVDARRQPGSAFKPVVAMAALSRAEPDGGPAFTLASLLPDEPLRVDTPAGPWEPANYSRSFEGPVTLREALERSLNVPFARLGIEVGGERIVSTARRLGIESPLLPYPSLALGASEISPMELTRAYGVLAAEGYRAGLRSVLFTTDHHGGIEEVPDTPGEQVYDPSEAYLVTSALLGVVERGTGRTLRDHGFRGDVAAKSGTTNDFRDAWFVGYTPTLVVGVWVGFDRGRPLQIPGAGAALPIFAGFLRDAVGSGGTSGPWGSDGFDVPPGLDRVRVDPSTGLRGGWGCRGEPEWFLDGTAPETSCRSFGRGWRSADERLADEVEALLRRGGSEGRRLLRALLERIGREGGGR